MKLLGPLCAMFVAISPTMAEDKTAFDASKIEGTWKIVSGIKYGEKVEAKSLEGTVIITKDLITIKGGDMTHEMTYKLDTKTTPVSITMTGKEGPAKDMTAEGIIELKGEQLKLCYGFPGEKRPTAFESKKDDKNLCFVMKKAK